MNIAPIAREFAALDTDEIVTTLSHLGLLQISGSGAKTLLQGQLTCNMDEISAQQSALGAHCNPQGRIISLSRIFYAGDSYYLQMPVEMIPIALAALQKYAVFFKVTMQDARDSLHSISFSGPHTDTTLAKIFSALPTKSAEVTECNGFLIIKLPGVAPHYQLIGEPAAIATLWEQYTEQATPCSENAWKVRNIHAGIPTIYASTSGKLLPHEINLQQLNAISFNKGCYTGQEIIARMHYRGQIKKQMFRARVKTDLLPAPGADIYHDGPCGTVVDSCQENETSCQILVVAKIAETENKTLFLDTANQTPLEFLSLPYAYST